MANTVAYGFQTLESLFGQRVSTLNAGQLTTAITESMAEWNRVSDALLARLVQRTTLATERYYIPGSGSLQPLDEMGNPLPVRAEGYYDTGFPIQGGGSAWGDTRITRAMMTVAEANRFTVDAMRRDADWLQRHMLAALLTKSTWTYSDPQVGSVTVQPLANGDAVTYPQTGGGVATANHYVAQTAGIADATNPFTTIYDLLRVHPTNAGPFVAYIPSGLTGAATGLAEFVAVGDANIALGANMDQVVGNIAAVRGFGDRVLGYLKSSHLFVVEWAAMPANTVIGQALGAAAPPLAMREYPAAELQGFFPELNDVDGNRMEHRLIRYAGFGALNRVAAAVVEVSGGDTTYDNISGYTAPLAA